MNNTRDLYAKSPIRPCEQFFVISPSFFRLQFSPYHRIGLVVMPFCVSMPRRIHIATPAAELWHLIRFQDNSRRRNATSGFVLGDGTLARRPKSICKHPDLLSRIPWYDRIFESSVGVAAMSIRCWRLANEFTNFRVNNLLATGGNAGTESIYNGCPTNAAAEASYVNFLFYSESIFDST